MPLWDRPNGPPTAAATVPPILLNTQATPTSPLPASQSIIATTETIITNPSLPSAALSCPVSPYTALEQTVFDVMASGYIKTTAAGTIALGLYAGASATVVAGNLLHKTASAVTQNTATAPWFMHAMLLYDSISGKLQGKGGGMINNTIDPEIAFTNVPTGISNLGNPVCTFSLSITSSGAGSGTPTTINVQKFNAG